MDYTQTQKVKVKGKSKVDVKFMTELALLTAGLLVMAYTPLG